MENTTQSSLGDKALRFGWGIVVVIALLAHGLALRADYYMDDYGFIMNSAHTGPAEYRLEAFGIEFGREGQDTMWRGWQMLLPTAVWELTHALFGVNAVAFHAWNLFLHASIAVIGLAVARRFFAATHLLGGDARRQNVAALWAAAVFACHPLCTEAVNYAKCVYVQLVALFSLLTCYGILRWHEAPGRKWAWLTLGFFLCASISYYYGMPLAAAQGTVLLWALRGDRFMPMLRGLKRISTPRKAALAGVLLPIGYMSGSWMVEMGAKLGEGAQSHWLTQGHAFWATLRRVVAPFGLCSDHYLPGATAFSDIVSLGKLLCMLAVPLAAVVVAWKMRGRWMGAAALALLLGMLPLLSRLGHRNDEIMVEYRMYPGMLWMAVLAGAGLCWLMAQRRLAGVALGVAAVAACMALSVERSSQWRSLRTINENVLAQYPLNNRSRTQLESYWLTQGDMGEVLALHREARKAYGEIVKFNTESTNGRRYSRDRAFQSMMESEHFATFAIAEMFGLQAGIAHAEGILNGLRRQGGGLMKNENEPGHITASLKFALDVLKARAAATQGEPAMPPVGP